MNRSQRWTPRGDSKLLFEFLPEDSSRQTYGLREALRVLDRISPGDAPVTLLDLGCGDGGSMMHFWPGTARRVGWDWTSRTPGK